MISLSSFHTSRPLKFTRYLLEVLNPSANSLDSIILPLCFDFTSITTSSFCISILQFFKTSSGTVINSIKNHLTPRSAKITRTRDSHFTKTIESEIHKNKILSFLTTNQSIEFRMHLIVSIPDLTSAWMRLVLVRSDRNNSVSNNNERYMLLLPSVSECRFFCDIL